MHTPLFSCYTIVAIITMLCYSEELHSYKDNVNIRSPKLIQIASLIELILLKWPHVNNRVQHVFVNCYSNHLGGQLSKLNSFII